MGVGYEHGIFVRDLTWRWSWSHVEALCRVLERWGFEASDDELYMSLDDAPHPANEAEARTRAKLMLAMSGPDGEQAAKIMGPSAHEDVDDESRYIVSAAIYLSSDFAVLESIEGEEIEVTVPATTDGVSLPMDYHPSYPAAAQVITATWTSTPPQTDADGWNQVWRVGVVFNCDKDIPSTAETRAGINKKFVKDIAAALGTAVVELGWYA